MTIGDDDDLCEWISLPAKIHGVGRNFYVCSHFVWFRLITEEGALQQSLDSLVFFHPRFQRLMNSCYSHSKGIHLIITNFGHSPAVYFCWHGALSGAVINVFGFCIRSHRFDPDRVGWFRAPSIGLGSQALTPCGGSGCGVACPLPGKKLSRWSNSTPPPAARPLTTDRPSLNNWLIIIISVGRRRWWECLWPGTNEKSVGTPFVGSPFDITMCTYLQHSHVKWSPIRRLNISHSINCSPCPTNGRFPYPSILS